MSAPKWLRDLGISESCISRKSSANERGRSFSIRPSKGDHIWCIKVDDCWIRSSGEKKADYLFWCQSRTGRRVIILVELKGKNFGESLQQIKAMLERLCKNADERGIHTGTHRAAPGHDQHDKGGVRAYVVLSKGRGVPKRQVELERIRQKYGVIVHPHEKRFEVYGIDALP